MTTVRLLFFSIILFTCAQHSANAELMVSPTRLVFNERDRAKELVLINSGNKQITYRLEWQEKKALVAGGYADIQKSEVVNFRTASQMMRFSPKQVSLKPGERQIIKLALRKPKGLKDDEYRSHLLLKALPPLKQADSKAGMSITLNVQMSYSLPVSVRQGAFDSNAKFENYAFQYDQSTNIGGVSVRLSKSGKHASFGNILAYWAPNSDEPKKLIARVNAYSIYPELTESQTNLIWLNEKFEPENGELTLVYEGTGEYRGTVFDSKTFHVTKDMFDIADKS
ncbi:fimbria/pilus periplasmic chaperone [Paraglaciecola agarilytica]|uniref:fimbria/pilus periplasmic chaperone n=1 Tax=Paraglaciecola chathamensis TaxID=368405 RepID=UPI001C093DA9|nr:fimbria/pilus periplasmic chaperone [Paraglaciecola agarilytica]MBU3016730.1 fimbria/pilus periplasmic chaperone [Paraglaciecola agarilytica]